MSNAARAPPQRKNVGFRTVVSGGRPAPKRPPVAEKQEEEESEEEEEQAAVWPPVRKGWTSEASGIDNQPPSDHVATTVPPSRPFAKEEEEEPEEEVTNPDPKDLLKEEEEEESEEEGDEQDAPPSAVVPRDPIMAQFVERLSNEYRVNPELTWQYLDQTQSLSATEALLKNASTHHQHAAVTSTMSRTVSGREALEVEQTLLPPSHAGRVVGNDDTPSKRRTTTPLKIRLGVREPDTDQIVMERSRASEYNRLVKAGRVDEFWKREKRRRRSSGVPLNSQSASTPFGSPVKRVKDGGEQVEEYLRAVKEKKMEEVMRLGSDLGRAAVLEQTMRLVDLNNAL